MLIWKESQFYNTKPRLTLLIQEICNVVVMQGQQFVSGEMLFRSIEEDNVPESIRLLTIASDVCNKLKNEFARYQVRLRGAVAAPPDGEEAAASDGPWDVPEELIFQRINNFLSRCEDIREFFRLYVVSCFIFLHFQMFIQLHSTLSFVKHL